MTHADIDTLVKRFLVDTATGPVNARVQQVVVRLVSDLFKAIEDLDLQPSEIWKGLEYLAEAGATHELGLLAPGIGLERFIDIRADEAEARAGLAGGTPRTIEGPLYVAGAPVSQGFARLDDGTEAGQGEVLFMQGTVYDTAGRPLPGARVEVWHANLMGNYSFFDKTQSAFNLRRTIVTDAQGRYQFRSIVPVGYACPPDGTTQRLLNLLGRHGRRPAHIHFFVCAPGHRKLTTQINIDGDEYLWDDFAFASREGLVPTIQRIGDAKALAEKGLAKPYASIDFDFRLYAERTGTPAAEVARERAAA
ncbi:MULTISPECIES: catechol 1,2-dioxygenase [Ralstonia solanacearum species complex]|uniref:catechol 1,2-dioxygenase n=1 Tax=Ralstonia solanacearum species complex TaxID=3116862 RepID=UPI00078DE384|nr:catechol 1,2-dioxygenase [Ralstonia solanacearum]BEU72200.1 catechol 1,2-dioxygenase [Ralstonia pseudosolanacearum]AMP37697.1 catechol 1,2-dioxygenase [Ralstonia solanacearum]AXV77083.1 catechol 1,2-dioxygenase [Ralstonia solanacearum]AXV86521.1 catechol 1,2-dioxygenase [Ralstonia solanacearum]AXV91100.1 catechol 1,2-dioxygenase [Ralstonia solanacearum]